MSSFLHFWRYIGLWFNLIGGSRWGFFWSLILPKFIIILTIINVLLLLLLLYTLDLLLHIIAFLFCLFFMFLLMFFIILGFHLIFYIFILDFLVHLGLTICYFVWRFFLLWGYMISWQCFLPLPLILLLVSRFVAICFDLLFTIYIFCNMRCFFIILCICLYLIFSKLLDFLWGIYATMWLLLCLFLYWFSLFYIS